MKLLQGALTYRDRRLAGFDAAAVVEVVEHIDPHRLPAFEEAVFRTARPGTVVLTTPNRDYNGRFATLAAGTMRHPDHRFEWSRAEFRAWAEGVSSPLRLHRPHRAGRRGRSGARRADPDGGLHPMRLSIPDFSLVVLIGPSGSGKSTFARALLPADRGRLVRCLPRPRRRRRDRPGGHARRLRGAPPDRGQAPRGAPPDRDRRHQCPRRGPAGTGRAGQSRTTRSPSRSCSTSARRSARRATASRPDRQFGPHVVRNQAAALRRSLKGLGREGFRFVHRLSSAEEADAAEIERRPLWTDRRSETGPFDIIGDVHGCHDELVRLLRDLGYTVEDGPEPRAVPPRRAQSGVPRRPGRPRPRRARGAAPRHGHGRGRPRAVRARQPRGQAAARAQGRQRQADPWAGRDPGAARGGAAGVRAEGGEPSSTAWSATTCSTAAGWWSPMPG